MIEKRDVQLDAPGEQPSATGPVSAAAEPGPAAVGAQAEGAPEEPKPSTADRPPMSEATASLMGLIDRLTSMLERSDLDELEVEAGQTGIVLRKPSALASVATSVAGAAPAAADAAGASDVATKAAEAAPAQTTRTVRAPLTGIFYGASSPGAPAYVTVGQQIAVGHVVGLIEAMKLFNEIKSDTAGRVVRVVAETGKLVKAKQPLIEVEP